MIENKESILILGGGFAGVEAAIKLRKYNYKVNLVSNRDYLFIYPVSIWIPVRKKSFQDVQISLKDLSEKHGFNVIIDEVKQINSEKKEVVLSSRQLTYDYLVVAMGMGKLNMKGLEYTHSICGKPDEAEIIKEKLDKLLDQGQGKIAIGFGGNPKDPSSTTLRGGPAFELLFNISHYLKTRKLRDKFEITFFAPMAEPGRKMGDKPYKKLNSFFSKYGIKVKKGKKITHFSDKTIHFEDGSLLESDLIIFISGGNGHPVLKNSDLPLNETGFIDIDEHCLVKNTNSVYAVGDIAALSGPKWASKQGHIAEVMADTAAYNIHMQIQGKEMRKDYKKHLNIICIMDSGDGAAFVMRSPDTEILLPLPIIGHWIKKAWGFYYKNSKLKRIPRIPGI